MRTARWNRFRQWLGLVPLPRVGQVWEVEYSDWNGSRTHAYYLLLRPGSSFTWKGVTTESWHVYDLEEGKFYDTFCPMPFEYQNGEKTRPYYRLVTEAP